MPKIEPSYETNSHKKDDPSYRIGLAIPVGKKYYAWITYNEEGNNVIYLMEINREHKISRIFWIYFQSFNERFELGTILYGTLVDSSEGKITVFLIEDILYDCGIMTKYFLFDQRMSAVYRFLREFKAIFESIQVSDTNNEFKYAPTERPISTFHHYNVGGRIHFALPVQWIRNERNNTNIGQLDEFGTIPEKWSNRIGYQVHHIQYRCPNKIAPFINIFFNKPSINIEGNLVTCSKQPVRELKDVVSYKCNFRADYNKPQYRIATTFLVKADIDADIYRLFAYGRNKTREYYGIAYIGSYETSVFMNRIFRDIKENENLDFIEESDDEEEFENVDPERFVDLEKEALVECIFSAKFKKWIPKRVVEGGKIVHIGQLCRDF
jgi:hypothetical protein